VGDPDIGGRVAESDPVTVVVGGFEPLVGCGVAHVLGADTARVPFNRDHFLR
jgi:hypothetical protein